MTMKPANNAIKTSRAGSMMEIALLVTRCVSSS